MRLYIVKEGDTLSSIAEKYGLELDQLIALNPQITNPDQIMPGMKIKIAAGPVSIAPGQPEIGHPITPVGQTETPFMQFPIPPVAAGVTMMPGGAVGDITGMVGTPGQPSGVTGGMSVNTGTQGQSNDATVGMQSQQAGISGSTPSISSMTSTSGTVGTTDSQDQQGAAVPWSVESNQQQAYLSTIPQYFAGNPMYSGVGAEQLQSPQDYTAPNSGVQQPLNIHVPYDQQANMVSPTSWSANQWFGNWPVEYTWSMPFAQMEANQANLSMSTTFGPADQPQTSQLSSVNMPMSTTFGPANQPQTSPLGSVNAPMSTTYGSVNMPMSTTFGPANQPQPSPFSLTGPSVQKLGSAKKNCGCGARSQIGHYSLAEKLRFEQEAKQAAQVVHADQAEPTAQAAESAPSDTFTAQEEARIAQLEEQVAQITDKNEEKEQSQNQSKSSTNKHSRNKTRRRSTNRKKRGITAHVHTTAEKRALPSRKHAAADGTLPASPWLSV